MALPATTRAVLDVVIHELRNTPRDCLRDPAEMVHRQNRLARRLEGIRDSRVSVALLAPRSTPVATVAALRAITARERAEAVFGSPPARMETRAIVSRKGGTVRVEVRRAGGAQMELGL